MESLKAKLEALRERIEGGMSAQFLKIMHEATQELEQSGIAQHVLKTGTLAPTFELEDQHGDSMRSEDLLSQGPLVLTFYRGFWCPYCNADLAHVQQFAAEIQSEGGTLLAISPEKQEYSRKIISTQKLSFDILWDAGNQLAAAFGLRFGLPDPLKQLYRDSFNINLKLYHGDDSWTLPLPSRFVIDQEGVIRYAESAPDYRERPEMDELMNVLHSLRQS